MTVQLSGNANEIYGASTHCKTGANFYWSGAAVVMRCQFAVNSITRTGTGTYAVGFNVGVGPSNSVAGSSRADPSFVGVNWAQYISFFDFSTNAIGIQTIDNGDVGVGTNEDTQNCSFTTTS